MLEKDTMLKRDLKCYWNEIFVSFFICSIYSFGPAYNHDDLLFL